ncbi:hypothetical protein PSH25_002930 [Micromonospora sp. PSH25]|nr:hypothetical protein [Micromonospora foliorum]MCG5434582.1 hypothetical protein [Micromonospora foliorum]
MCTVFKAAIRQVLPHALLVVAHFHVVQLAAPVGFHITANGTNPDGTSGIAIDDIVPNTYDGTNLGAFNDPNTGAPVPTGGMS